MLKDESFETGMEILLWATDIGKKFDCTARWSGPNQRIEFYKEDRKLQTGFDINAMYNMHVDLGIDNPDEQLQVAIEQELSLELFGKLPPV